eukprot:TRINITY_DN5773_c0_g1_i6.p1 TRINITY_DN5773_c0_g1~~TRINITY_DN5773_c0_g1_i6.p1  ORF type:complete len:243 (-),score=-15.42 TRINITY_DN5773_c0_g1_i6:21-749(-)
MEVNKKYLLNQTSYRLLSLETYIYICDRYFQLLIERNINPEFWVQLGTESRENRVYDLRYRVTPSSEPQLCQLGLTSECQTCLKLISFQPKQLVQNMQWDKEFELILFLFEKQFYIFFGFDECVLTHQLQFYYYFLNFSIYSLTLNKNNYNVTCFLTKSFSLILLISRIIWREYIITCLFVQGAPYKFTYCTIVKIHSVTQVVLLKFMLLHKQFSEYLLEHSVINQYVHFEFSLIDANVIVR